MGKSDDQKEAAAAPAGKAAAKAKGKAAPKKKTGANLKRKEDTTGSKDKSAADAAAPPAKKAKLVLGGKSDSKQTPSVNGGNSAPGSGPTASAKVPQSSLKLPESLKSQKKQDEDDLVSEDGNDYVSVPLDWERVKAPGKPEDTYEMSDYGDDNSVQGTPDRSKKRIPEWFDTWLDDYEKQADVDPDTVFGGNIPRVDLREVFPTSSNAKKIIERGSLAGMDQSAVWRRDKLRKEECLNYRFILGQSRRMDELWLKPKPKAIAEGASSSSSSSSAPK